MSVAKLVPALVLAACCWAAQPRFVHAQSQTLPVAVVEKAAAAGIALEDIGAIVLRRGEPRPLVAHQATRAFQPASTLKVLTSSVALETLGPDYRARTELRMQGSAKDGVLRGDLVLVGRGDVDFDRPALDRMLRRLRAMGVREIRGNLLIDRSFFEPARTDLGLPPFDQAPEFRYNVVPDALPLDMGLTHLEIAEHGGRLSIEPTPAVPGLRLRSEMKLVDVDCDTWDDLWQTPRVERAARGTMVATLQGEFPRGCAIGTDIALLDRDEHLARSFRALWSAMGGRFTGRVREGRAAADTTSVAEHRSRALAEIARDVNKRSDNPVTRTVFLTLGALSPQPPDGATTATRAERVVREWLRNKQVDDVGLVLENGSGLSRRERIAPATLAAVIERALDGPWAPEFASSLPIVAVDGGMRKRLVGTPAAGHARIKTGTLRDTWAIAGYVDAADGARYVVVAMINREGVSPRDARDVLDTLIGEVAKGLR